MTGIEKVEAKIRNQVKTKLNKMNCEKLAKGSDDLDFHAVTNLNWILHLLKMQTEIIDRRKK